MAATGEKSWPRTAFEASQAVLMVQWLWSLSRLCVAVTKLTAIPTGQRICLFA